MERRFKTCDWLMIGGAGLLLVASVLPWWRVRVDEMLSVSLDAYEFTMTGQVPVIALVAIAVIIVIVRTESLPLPDWLVHPYLLTPVTAVVALLVSRRFLFSGFDSSGSVSRGVGLYLGLVAVLLALGGGVLAIRDLRHPDSTADDDADRGDDEDAVDQYGYGDQFDDDLTRRFNTALPSGDAPVRRTRRPSADGEPTRRRTTSASDATLRRRTLRSADEPPARTRRRPRDAPPA